jgi:hypothetical protein
MDRIAVLEERVVEMEQRVANLEQRLGRLAQRQGEDGVGWHEHRLGRLQVHRSPSRADLRLVPPVHTKAGDAGSRNLWMEQMKRRIALLIKKSCQFR